MSLTKVSYSMIQGAPINAFDYMTPAQIADVQAGTMLQDVTAALQAALVVAKAEMGLPEAQYDSWSGIVAPLNTPRRIVEQLNSDVLHVLQSQKLRVRFDLLGAEPVVDSTPEGFMRFMQEEYLRFQGILQDKSIKKNPKDLLP